MTEISEKSTLGPATVREWLDRSAVGYGSVETPDVEPIDWQFRAHFPSEDEPSVIISIGGGREMRINRTLMVADEHLKMLDSLPPEEHSTLVFHIRRDLLLSRVIFGLRRNEKGIISAVSMGVRLWPEEASRSSVVSAMQRAYDAVILTRTRIRRTIGEEEG